MNYLKLLLLVSAVSSYYSKDWGLCGQYSDQDCISEGWACCSLPEVNASKKDELRRLQATSTSTSTDDTSKDSSGPTKKVCVDANPFI